jgi:RNA polymerase sigma-70 factor (ECF subfamily)
MKHPLASSSSDFSSLSSPAVAHQLESADLVLLCQQQLPLERTLFTELLRRYGGHVDRLLYRLAPDWGDRADLAQEVWLRVYRNIRRLKEPSRFKSWLGRITANLFYDELRRRKRSSTLSLDAPLGAEVDTGHWDIPSTSPGPVDSLMTQEFYHRLQRSIGELPEVFRTAIMLREVQGLTYDQIATMTGVSLGTVKSRIARARQRLQQDLMPYLEGL